MGKHPLRSKTNWVNLVLALLAFVPGASEWISAHPEASALIAAGVNLILRFFTKEPVTLKKVDPLDKFNEQTLRMG